MISLVQLSSKKTVWKQMNTILPLKPRQSSLTLPYMLSFSCFAPECAILVSSIVCNDGGMDMNGSASVLRTHAI
jgi:hypothetical protein